MITFFVHRHHHRYVGQPLYRYSDPLASLPTLLNNLTVALMDESQIIDARDMSEPHLTSYTSFSTISDNLLPINSPIR